MPADLTAPFKESCCDGGATSNENSCQPCGCDPGANWMCQRHKIEKALINTNYEWIKDRVLEEKDENQG